MACIPTVERQIIYKMVITDSDEAMLWFLGFCNKVEVIATPQMVEKMKTEIEKIKGKYEE